MKILQNLEEIRAEIRKMFAAKAGKVLLDEVALAEELGTFWRDTLSIEVDHCCGETSPYRPKSIRNTETGQLFLEIPAPSAPAKPVPGDTWTLERRVLKPASPRARVDALLELLKAPEEGLLLDAEEIGLSAATMRASVHALSQGTAFSYSVRALDSAGRYLEVIAYPKGRAVDVRYRSEKVKAEVLAKYLALKGEEDDGLGL
jgi:hypothetical protein